MKKENRLLTIDGETLMSQPLTPLNFVVDTLLSQGLHILAGSPKVGKSWLALWLAVTVAKGEAVWGMGVKQGTTLYLCLEDSTLRIQNRLFEITEDAPASVHFTTNSDTLGKGLEEQLCAFLSEHPDTVLIIIDTLQMIRGAGYDNTYANDYRDLSALKRIADAHGIAILLIHHLRKEFADDVFSRISGTTAISGAVDSSFTLVEDRRGSGRATLSCIGRDIEYRELTLERNAENVWELMSDSRTQPELLGDRIVILLSELMRDRTEFIGTPTELSAQIDPVGSEGITPKKVSRLILQSVAALSKIGISAVVRRSNGKRLIELRRAESDDAQGSGHVLFQLHILTLNLIPHGIGSNEADRRRAQHNNINDQWNPQGELRGEDHHQDTEGQLDEHINDADIRHRKAVKLAFNAFPLRKCSVHHI